MSDAIRSKEINIVINADNKQAMKAAADLEGVLHSIQQLSRNGKLSSYWADQATLIKKAEEAFKRYNKEASVDNSKELLKTVNALKAISGNELPRSLQSIDEIEQTINTLKSIELDGMYSVDSFQKVFKAFEQMRQYGIDMQALFGQFSIDPNIDGLVTDLNRANETISNLRSKMDQLQDKLDESESGNGIRVLRDECEDLKYELDKIRQEAEETFYVFLKSHNIDAYDFDEFFQRIREGSMTAQEAIAEFKRDYTYLLDNNVSFDTSQLQDFSKRLDLVSEKITEVARKIDDISSNGIKVGEVSNTANIEVLSSTLKELCDAGVSGDASTIYEALSKILTIIKEIGQVNTDNISNLYGVIRNLAKLNDLKINKASLMNLAECIERICNINSTSALTNLSILDLTKFNDLNIKKASLKNLAEYLPQIANIDVNNLIELTKVDFSNLNNLKVDKASLETLRNFAESLRAVVQNNDQNVSINNVGHNQTSDEIAAMEKLEKATEEAANAQREFSHANDTVEGSANDSKTPLQLEAELMEQIAKNAREAADAKKEFVEANKQLKESAESSADALGNEDAKLKKDKYAKRNKISEDGFLNNSDHYSSIANEALKSSGRTILGETVNTELVNGLVKVTAKIKDVDGTWKSFSARIDEDGNMFEQRFKTITKGVDKLETELENFGRETAPALSYQETLNKAQEIKEKLNLDGKFSVVVDSNEFVTITKKLSDIEGATVSVVQTFKSAEDAINNFGKEASNAAEQTKATLNGITQSNGSTTKENLMSIKDAYQILINTKQEYLDLNAKRLNNTATDEELRKLDELIAKRKQANDVVSVNAINETAKAMNKLSSNNVGDEFKNAFSNANREIEKLNAELKSGSLDVDEYRKKVNAITDGLSGKSVDGLIKKISSFNKHLNSSFKNDIGIENFHNSLKSIINDYDELISLQQKGVVTPESMSSLSSYFTAMKSDMSIALDSFETKGMPADFITKLSQAREQLDLVKASLDKVEKGEAFTEEDITNIDKYINQVRDLKNANDKLANSSKVSNMLGEIAETLNKNTAMSKELRQEFEKLSMEIKSYGDNLPADKLKEFGSRLEALKTQMKESGQTGLSFFDGVMKKAKSMSQNFIAMYFSLYDIIRYVRNGVNQIRELDKAFTEMRKVSDESTQSLRRFQEASFDIAKTVGTTAQQIQNSTADWMGEILVPLYGNI